MTNQNNFDDFGYWRCEKVKKGYLTIDDGPSCDRREKVDILQRYNIPAIWFCLGKELELNRESSIYTIRSGGIIGNHSYSHPRFSELSLDECYEEIIKTDRIIDQLYACAEVDRPVKIFRFPYGDRGVGTSFYDFNYNPVEEKRLHDLQMMLAELGYSCPTFSDIEYEYYKLNREKKYLDWYWTYDVMEWCVFQTPPQYGIKGLAEVLELMDLNLPERWAGLNYEKSADIILIHDHPQTTYLFEDIIIGLLAKEIIFENPVK